MQTVPLAVPPDPAALTCTLIENFLSPAECAALIARLEGAGIGATAALYPPSYRNNDRLVLDDAELAATLYGRMAQHAPAVLVEENAIWHRQGLNTRFRCCRYRDGQRFTIHRDGEYHAGPLERSRLTFMIYLNDGEEFHGGATRYYRDRSGQELLRSVTPRRGACILFDHALWHDGEAVNKGTKYVLRSDVIYRRESELETTPSPQHLGYIWSAILLKNGWLVSAGRDQTIRVFSYDADHAPLRERQVLRGHDSSVACLLEARDALWSGDRTGRLARWTFEGDSLRFDSALNAHKGATLALARIAGSRFKDCIATSGADGAVRLFSDSQQPVCELFGHSGWVWALAAADDFLYSGGEEGIVMRHALGGDAPRMKIQLDAPVHALLCTKDRLLVGMSDGRLLRLDPTTLAPISERLAHRGSLRCLMELRDGRIASGGEDDAVAIWSSDLTTELGRYFHTDFVRAIVELADGALLSASYDGRLRCVSPLADARR